MPDDRVQYTLRVPKELLKKFTYIAKYDGRSTTRQLERMMKAKVDAFEQKHGEIELDSEGD